MTKLEQLPVRSIFAVLLAATTGSIFGALLVVNFSQVQITTDKEVTAIKNEAAVPMDFGAAGRITDDGNWLLGATSQGQPYTRLFVSKNASFVPPGDAHTIVHFAGADDMASRVLFDGFNRHMVLVFRRAQGTAISPEAVRRNDSFGSIGGTGYGTTGYNTGPYSAKVAIDFRAAETWTDTAQGTFFTIETTRIGTKNREERLRVDNAGNVIVNTGAIPTDAADGFLYVPTTAGTPSGIPTEYAGRSPIVVDSVNNKLYFYSGGAWRSAGTLAEPGVAPVNNGTARCGYSEGSSI